jgi:hypothetical protein
MALEDKWDDENEGLREDEIAALDYVFGGMEAAVGVRSSCAAEVDRLAGIRYGSRSYEALWPVEYWGCWSTETRRRAGLLARRALRAMNETPEERLYVSVLFRAYGPRPPGPEFDSIAELGLLGRIAVFTEAAVEVADGAQSIAGALAAVLLAATPALPQPARAATKRDRRAVLERVRDEASRLLADSVGAFRAARAEVGRADHGR